MSFHSNRTPLPSSSHLSPVFLQSYPLLHCFKCKINIKPRSCTIFRPVSAELEPSVKPVVPLSRPCSMQEWFSPFVPCLRRRRAELVLFRLSLSEGLILSSTRWAPSVYTLPYSVRVVFLKGLLSPCAFESAWWRSVLQVSVCLCMCSQCSTLTPCCRLLRREGELLWESNSKVREESCLHCCWRRCGRGARLEKGKKSHIYQK